jgi:hypothetical protein
LVNSKPNVRRQSDKFPLLPCRLLNTLALPQ